jgi:ribosomal protein S12 methylthiotransferase accessory factor
VPPTPASATLPRLRSFVSPLTGVVRGLSETLAAPGELRLVGIGCELADGLPTIGTTLESYTGSEHWSRELAEAAAIGEALERYSGSYIPSDRVVIASAAELGEDAVAPERFALFSDEQYGGPAFPFRPGSVSAISPLVPTRQFGNVLWGAADGHVWRPRDWFLLGAWTIVFAALGAWGYRRDEGRKYR